MQKGTHILSFELAGIAHLELVSPFPYISFVGTTLTKDLVI